MPKKKSDKITIDKEEFRPRPRAPILPTKKFEDKRRRDARRESNHTQFARNHRIDRPYNPRYYSTSVNSLRIENTYSFLLINGNHRRGFFVLIDTAVLEELIRSTAEYLKT